MYNYISQNFTSLAVSHLKFGSLFIAATQSFLLVPFFLLLLLLPVLYQATLAHFGESENFPLIYNGAEVLRDCIAQDCIITPFAVHYRKMYIHLYQ